MRSIDVCVLAPAFTIGTRGKHVKGLVNEIIRSPSRADMPVAGRKVNCGHVLDICILIPVHVIIRNRVTLKIQYLGGGTGEAGN